LSLTALFILAGLKPRPTPVGAGDAAPYCSRRSDRLLCRAAYNHPLARH
jgi:hypothetical protein